MHSKSNAPFRHMRICSSSEMRELDRIAEEDFGISAAILMENAGRAAAQILLETYPHAGSATEILVFAGKGNNAGDAFVVARRLISLDRRVRIFHFEDTDRYKGPVRQNFEILKKMKARMISIESGSDLEAFFAQSTGPFTIVDGILGTGLKGGLEGVLYDVVEIINAQHCAEVVALDIPSGVSGDTGAIVGNSIQATQTISFGFPKLGHFLPPGASRRGDLLNVDICLPPRFRKEGSTFLLMKAPLASLLKERDRYGHKNSFGHTLLIGGSPGRLGAIAMSASACHKMGTGLVTVGTWEENFEALVMKLPHETMAAPLRFEGENLSHEYRQFAESFSSIVVGPGMGLSQHGLALLKELLSGYAGPLVIDADGLNLVAEHQLHEMIKHRKAPTVLTPHPGEMARLLDLPKDEVTADPVRAIRQAVDRTHAIVLLKGAATLVSSPHEELYLNHYPNDGMATAGSGDVLAGMIGGLLGQKMPPFEATQLGVYLHSLAGDFAARTHGHRSMTAPDIIENIANAIKDIKTATPGTLPVEVLARLR